VIDAVDLFFVLGVIARTAKSDLRQAPGTVQIRGAVQEGAQPLLRPEDASGVD
jgi:hypothetical protein